MITKYAKYQASWVNNISCLSSFQSDVFKSYCKACNSTKQDGMNKLKWHKKISKHLSVIRNFTNQSLVVAISCSLQLSYSPLQEAFRFGCSRFTCGSSKSVICFNK